MIRGPKNSAPQSQGFKHLTTHAYASSAGRKLKGYPPRETLRLHGRLHTCREKSPRGRRPSMSRMKRCAVTRLVVAWQPHCGFLTSVVVFFTWINNCHGSGRERRKPRCRGSLTAARFCRRLCSTSVHLQGDVRCLALRSCFDNLLCRRKVSSRRVVASWGSSAAVLRSTRMLRASSTARAWLLRPRRSVRILIKQSRTMSDFMCAPLPCLHGSVP